MSGGHGDKIGRKAERLIAALLTEPTQEAAAAKVGLSRRTVTNWLSREEFLVAYRASRRQVVEYGIGRAQAMIGRAAEALERNLTCGRPADEIRAAVAIYGQSIQGGELVDMVEQVEKLRAVVAEVKREREAERKAN